MKLKFVKLSPTRNMTILVETPVARENYAFCANALMKEDSVGGEQVGYIVRDSEGARLEMMGGEFCGNATMTFGALLSERSGMKIGEECRRLLRISGVQNKVACTVKKMENGYLGTVEMPLPKDFKPVVFCGKEYPSVGFEGIRHIIVHDALDEDRVRGGIAAACRLLGEEALGVMLCSDKKLIPYVYVAATGSCVRESCCGSGTAALGCFAAHTAKADASLTVTEPGGVMQVCAQTDGENICRVCITGNVKICCEGTAWINDPQEENL